MDEQLPRGRQEWVLVANIGLSDLYYNVGTDEAPDFCNFTKVEGGKVQSALQCQEFGAWHFGARLREMLIKDAEITARKLRYPLLHPVLDTLATDAQRLDRVVLIGTDQQDEQEHRHDTLNSAYVLASLIEHDFPQRVRCTQVVAYEEDPTLDTRAYPKIGEILQAVADPTGDVIAALYIESSGGVPKLGQATVEQAWRLYAQRAHVYTVRSRTGAPPRADVPDGEFRLVTAAQHPFLRDVSRDLAEGPLNRYDFSGARHALTPFAGLYPAYPTVEVALDYAACRANLDYSSAAAKLGKSVGPPFEDWAAQVEVNRQSTDRLYQQIVDAWALAVRYNQNGDYAAMLWLIAAFYENALRLIAATNLPRLGLADIDKETLSRAEIKARYPAAVFDFTNSGLPKKEKDAGILNVGVLRWLSEQDNGTEVQPQVRAKLLAARDRLTPLNDLHKQRHELVHHLSGRARAAGTDALTCMQEALRLLQFARPTPSDPFTEVVAYVQQQLWLAPAQAG